jgi:DNA polymerase III epsilon subunit-like protein
LETTGFKINVDSIIEIAGLEIVDKKITGNQFHCYVKLENDEKNEGKIHPLAFKVHKIDEKSLKNSICNCYPLVHPIDFVLKNFLKFVNNAFFNFLIF